MDIIIFFFYFFFYLKFMGWDIVLSNICVAYGVAEVVGDIVNEPIKNLQVMDAILHVMHWEPNPDMTGKLISHIVVEWWPQIVYGAPALQHIPFFAELIGQHGQPILTFLFSHFRDELLYLHFSDTMNINTLRAMFVEIGLPSPNVQTLYKWLTIFSSSKHGW